jgi:xanthine dehydrogenase accessory factor
LSWISEKLAEGYDVALATVIDSKGSIPGKPGAKLAMIKNGEKFGTIGGAGLELKIEKALYELIKRPYRMSTQGGRIENFLLYKNGKGKEVIALDSLCGGQLTVSLEVINTSPNILIVGGGHVGKSLASVCDSIGWEYSIFDVRKEFSNEERFPYAEKSYTSSIPEFLDSEDEKSLSRFSDIFLLGHDWSLDQEILIGILSKVKVNQRPRVGCIGSKTKWSAFREAALNANIPSSVVDSTRCPIGLGIGAHTPEEIAIAICAEIIALDAKQPLNND